jgi:hypothetical protein
MQWGFTGRLLEHDLATPLNSDRGWVIEHDSSQESGEPMYVKLCSFCTRRDRCTGGPIEACRTSGG